MAKPATVHLIDLRRVSDKKTGHGVRITLSHGRPDGTFRGLAFGDDISAQTSALELRDELIAAGEAVSIRNFL